MSTHQLKGKFEMSRLCGTFGLGKMKGVSA